MSALGYRSSHDGELADARMTSPGQVTAVTRRFMDLTRAPLPPARRMRPVHSASCPRSAISPWNPRTRAPIMIAAPGTARNARRPSGPIPPVTPRQPKWPLSYQAHIRERDSARPKSRDCNHAGQVADRPGCACRSPPACKRATSPARTHADPPTMAPSSVGELPHVTPRATAAPPAGGTSATIHPPGRR
jgi:hypothetical protein